MRKLFLRTIAVGLIPCFIADPSWSAVSVSSLQLHALPPSRLHEEALAVHARWVHRVLDDWRVSLASLFDNTRPPGSYGGWEPALIDGAPGIPESTEPRESWETKLTRIFSQITSPEGGGFSGLSKPLRDIGIVVGKSVTQPGNHPPLAMTRKVDSVRTLVQAAGITPGRPFRDPRHVSVPVRYLPSPLMDLLNWVEIESVEGRRMNARQYLLENVDEIIFTPFRVQVEPDGHVIQAGGSVIHGHTAQIMGEGLRVIYLSLARFMMPDGHEARHADQLAPERIYPISEVDLLQDLVEEVARLETMNLVLEGRLSRRFYDAPTFVWFEKIGKTVRWHAFASLLRLLKELNLNRPGRAEALIAGYRQETEEKLRKLNRTLELPENDFGYSSFRGDRGKFDFILPLGLFLRDPLDMAAASPSVVTSLGFWALGMGAILLGVWMTQLLLRKANRPHPTLRLLKNKRYTLHAA